MAEREARRSAAKTQSRRLARSEARLLTWAIAFACVVCGLMVVYLAAYAHVHLLGDQQAAMHSEWHKKWQENQSLRGEVASLQSPARIGARAAALGLTQDPKRVDYILPPPAGNTLAASTAGTLSDAEQGRESAEAGQSGMESSNLLMTEMGGKADSQVETRGTTSDDNSTDRND
jgi:cell division protein FtsL